MNPDPDAPHPPTAPPGLFPATSWKTVIEARQSGSGADRAMERLLLRYYAPIERVIRIQRHGGPDDARDLAHEFIASCLKRDFLREVGPEKGRFRTFVNRCLVHFLRDQWSRATAQKRGSGVPAVSLQETDDDGRERVDVSGSSRDPGFELDRAWAARVVGLAMEALERECQRARRASLFRELSGQISGREPASDSAGIAARLGSTKGAVDVALHRLRRRFGELVVEEVKASVGESADWREELRYLLELVSRSEPS
jgi:DNA-directed RNA polymerase specialized sigma24 family protein